MGLAVGLGARRGLAFGFSPKEESWGGGVSSLVESWLRQDPLGTGFSPIRGTGFSLIILGFIVALLGLCGHFVLYVKWASLPQCIHFCFLPGRITRQGCWYALFMFSKRI